MSPVPFTDSRWTFLNEPKTVPEIREDGKELTLLTNANTDWWRTPEIDSKSGVVYGFYREIGEEGFEISVDLKVNQKDRVRSDQATLFLHLSPTAWVKTGTEFDAGRLWNSAVVCNPYSDWSLQRHTPTASTRFTISLKADRELLIFLGDDMMREVKAFGPEDLAAGQKVFIGVMGCSPKGGNAEAVFKGFDVREGIRAKEE